MKIKVSDIAKCAMASAILCVLAPVSIAVGAIPISLATFGVYIISAVFGKIKAPVATVIYILLGIIGLPVFSNFGAGIGKVVGPTGGYIIGYIFGALLIGLIVDKWKDKFFVYPVAMILGTVCWYLLGTLWYMYVAKTTLAAALSLCVVPFLIFDAVKIIIASIVSFSVRKTVDKL